MTVTPLSGGNFMVRWMFSSRTTISLRREKLIQSAFSEITHIFRLIYLNLFVCVVRRTSVDIQILYKSTNSFPNASETGNALPKHPSRLNFWETAEGKSADERRRQREHQQRTRVTHASFSAARNAASSARHLPASERRVDEHALIQDWCVQGCRANSTRKMWRERRRREGKKRTVLGNLGCVI